MRVVITGLGAVSSLGLTLCAIEESLREGRSGIDIDPERVSHGFRSPLTGVVRHYNPRDYVSRKEIKSMGQPAQFAVGAAVNAVRDANLNEAVLHATSTGLIVGNDSCAVPVLEAVDSVRAHNETRYIGSGNILQVMTSTVSMNLATFFGVRGASWSVSAACASGAHAIGQGYMLIKSGMQNVVLAGGAQEVSWESMCSFDAIGAFAKLEEGEPPQQAVRPFARDRKGLVPSGGAAMLVLEALEHAVARGAKIYGEVVGYGFTSDGTHLTQPDGDGSVRAMRMALEQARLTPGEVEYINAHATSTPVGDLTEGRSIIEVFGRPTPPVSSTKSMTGHECWMAGASEVLYTLLMMRGGFLAPNINLRELDPELEGLDVLTTRRDTRARVALSNSFGFGGTNASLLLRAVEGHAP